MNNDIIDQYLLLCKHTYLNKITPSGNTSKETKEYQELVNIAKEYFDNNRYTDFAGFLQEGQYFISLWTAHLLLEYGKASKDLIQQAILTIKTYSDNPLARDVANEEREWLKKNVEKFG